MKTQKAFMVVTRLNSPVVLNGHLPIYWQKRIAEDAGEKYAGLGHKIVKVEIKWED